jgi:hypothetical protein
MHTMHPTLLIGPADWDPASLPREEFAARREQFWRSRPDARGAIVYGDPGDHAALAYLTHFTPKLEAAIALIPRDGPPRLLVGGGVNMVAAARPLTPIEDVAPLRNPGKTVLEWVRSLPGTGQLVLINDQAMPVPLHNEIENALEGIVDRDIVHYDSLHVGQGASRKSQLELVAIREACAILKAAVTALAEAQRKGAGVTAAVLAGEHAAHRAGAQDVRSLFSLDGGRTLRPFAGLIDRRVDPLQVYLAVRHAGYWAEGFVMLAEAPHPPLDAACRALNAALSLGSHGGRLADIIAGAAYPRRLHPITGPVVMGGSLHPVELFKPGSKMQDFERGLAGRPYLPAGERSRVAVGAGLALGDWNDSSSRYAWSGGVMSLRAGVLGDDGAAIVSAMVFTGELGHAPEVLWSAADLGDAAS